MPDYDLSQVDCVLYEPEGHIRRLLRDSLGQLKLQKVEGFGSLDEVRTFLQGNSPDLLIADAAGPDSEVFKLISALRHNQFGGNPFLGVIVTTFHPTSTLLSRMTNSGADALLVKPLSPKQMLERIAALIETPRKFVVASDFVGPDRRKNPREGSQIQFLDVPNTLRLKASGMANKVDARTFIEKAVAEVNAQKLIRQSFQVAFLLDFAMPGLSGDAMDRLALDHLMRAPLALEDLIRRLPAGADGAPVPTAEKCRALIDAIVAFKDEPSAEKLGDLKAQAAAIMQAIQPTREPEALAREVAAAANAYRTRLEQLAQAKAAELAGPAPQEEAGAQQA